VKCALVEFTPFHGEIVPTFVQLLNRLGIEVDVYLRSEVLTSDPFAFSPSLVHKAYRLESPLVRLRLKARSFAGYDVVIVTSCEPRQVLRRLRPITVPVVGVVHNVVLLEEDREYRDFFEDHTRVPLVLARHQSDYLSSQADTRWVAPVHLMEDPWSNEPSWSGFCVQGWTDFRRRNYAGLLDAVEILASQPGASFEIVLVGKDYGLDGLRLRRAIRQRGLDDRFRVTGDLPEYSKYFNAIASCGFTLPLVDSSPHLRMYFEDKITSSISMAVGLGRIPVIHADLADLYGLGSAAVTYTGDGLATAMRSALDLDSSARHAMIERLRATREAWLEASQENLANTLRNLGLEP